MVRFDIVGMSSCPWFAKAVKLADEIAWANPRVEFHHEMLDKFHWHDFCDKVKLLRGWDIRRSPVVYEVLVDPNGKAVLIGDCSDFCEFAAMYFDIYYDPTTSALQGMAMTNITRFGHGFQYGGVDQGDSVVLNISIVKAPMQMLELLLPQLVSPISMVPPGVLLNIRILDTTTDLRELNGLFMEVEDMASPSLLKIGQSSTLASCFYRCDLLILAEDLSREPTEEMNDWISRVELNVAEMLGVLNDKRTEMLDARIIVGGNGPQCYIAEMIRGGVPIPKAGLGRIVASGQFIAQKAKAELSKIGKIPAGCISRIQAYGWPGETGAYVEVKNAVMNSGELAVRGPGVEIPLTEVATNCDYIFTKFSKEFLRLQRKALKYTFAQPTRCYMPFAESILNTVQIWLSSELLVRTPTPKLITPSTNTKKNSTLNNSNSSNRNNGPQSNPSGGGEAEGDAIHNLRTSTPLSQWNVAPILNVGVPTTPSSTFPTGTFMVQPAICVQGRWEAVGLISTKTHPTVVEEVNKLWVEREQLIFRDKNIARALFPDFDELTQPREYVRPERKPVEIDYWPAQYEQGHYEMVGEQDHEYDMGEGQYEYREQYETVRYVQDYENQVPNETAEYQGEQDENLDVQAQDEAEQENETHIWKQDPNYDADPYDDDPPGQYQHDEQHDGQEQSGENGHLVDIDADTNGVGGNGSNATDNTTN